MLLIARQGSADQVTHNTKLTDRNISDDALNGINFYDYKNNKKEDVLGADSTMLTGKNISNDEFDGLNFNDSTHSQDDKLFIKNDPLFKHINRIQNGAKDDFDISAYVKHLGFDDSENIIAWLHSVAGLKKRLLGRCNNQEEAKQALVAHYKMLFNIFRDVDSEVSVRFRSDENFRLHRMVQKGMYDIKVDLTYVQTCTNQLEVDDATVVDLMTVVNHVIKKYSGCPSAVLLGTQKCYNEVRNLCCEGYAPSKSDLLHKMEGRIIKNICEKYNENGRSGETKQLKVNLRKDVIPKEVAKEVTMVFA
ncbi:MAG: hypothetical protein KAG53_06915 [Endozoicomonadaceae bacterium]|nr:hypothetical protein [Endozoicomonadaceae bacterium]